MKGLDNGLGIWQILNSNLITDIIASSGFDFVILDLEHGLHTPETIQNCIHSAKASSISTVARLPNDYYPYTVQVIDTGIDAIIFPHVETEDQLGKIVNQTFLSPIGSKSFSPFVPRFNYGQDCNKDDMNPLLGILIESNLGVKNAEKLIENKNVDFVYFGAYDLSVELNKPGQIFEEDLIERLSYLVKISKKNSKKIMSIYRNEIELEILIKEGVDFPIASVDTSQFIKKLQNECEIYNKIRTSY
jgi:4-hydroxy-2-oxoheptanedioate aldolase